MDVTRKNQKTVLITCHRRENFGNRSIEFYQQFVTWLELKKYSFYLPTHPNPEVQSAVKEVLKQPIANLLLDIANELPRNGLLDEKLPFCND